MVFCEQGRKRRRRGGLLKLFITSSLIELVEFSFCFKKIKVFYYFLTML